MLELACGTQTACAILLVEHAQQIGAEVDFPHPGLLPLQPDDFPAEGPPDEPLAALPIESAIGTDPPLAPRDGINPGRQPLGQATWAGAVMFRRWPQAQRFVRPQFVVTGPPAIGAALLRRRVPGGLVGDFGLIHAMHLFMGRVVLWVRGAAKLDADPQPPPPDRQARKSARANPAKGWAVVHTDDFGQAVTAKHPGQRASRRAVTLVGQEPDIQEEAAFEIPHR